MLRLLDLLFPPREDELTVRALNDEELAKLSAPRIVLITNPPCATLLPFSDPRVRAAVHEAKYHGNERALSLLACVLRDYLRREETLAADFVIVPVPLGSARLRERSYNQSEKIARAAAREFGISVRADFLERTRETEPQTALAREKREENLRGAFRAAAEVSGRSCILFDDVITTGATLRSGIHALRAAGALRILPVALAH